MLNELQKRTAQAVVNIFETGSARGEYGMVTLLPGDSGHLTYGRAQTTLASGNLHLLIKAYCEAEGAQFAGDLRPFLAALEARDTGLDHDFELRGLLREAGDDPVMRVEQDAFFDRAYWDPAVRSAGAIGAKTALGMCIVYDSRVHGSWGRMRDRTNGEKGELSKVGEHEWFSAYIATRRNWLATHPNTLLNKTVYRMDALSKLVDNGDWDLELPLVVRGVRIDEEILTAPLRPSAEDETWRVLKLRQPFMRGDDVKALQEALKSAGIDVTVDGIFGPGTERAVIAFQIREDLTVDGIAGPATRAALEG